MLHWLYFLLMALLGHSAYAASPAEYCSSYEDATCILKPGNFGLEMPEPSDRTAALMWKIGEFVGQPSFAEQTRINFQDALKTISQKKDLIAEIKKVSVIYNVKPEAILAAIAVEITLNIDWKDVVQEQLARVAADLPEGELPMLNEKKLKDCLSHKTAPYAFTKCYYASTINDQAFRQNAWKFGTLGIGQINPLKILTVDKIIHEREGKPLIDGSMRSVFMTALDPLLPVHYIAANMELSQNMYRDIAGFDISNNIGIVATLYNLGTEYSRAEKLRVANIGKFQPPQPNLFGWIASQYEDQLAEVFK